MVTENLKLAWDVVNRYGRQMKEHNIDPDDLYQHAVVTLVNMAGEYDRGRNITFSSYVYQCMLRDVAQEIERLTNVLAVKPKSQGNKDEHKATKKHRESLGKNARSLDYELSPDSGSNLSSLMADECEPVLDAMIRREHVSRVRSAIDGLRDREQVVIEEWMAKGCTYGPTDLHREMGVSRQRVKQIRDGAIKKITRAVKPLSVDFANS